MGSLLNFTSPRLDASLMNLLNLENPKLPSSKFPSSSIMTCLSRSERMTSPRFCIRASADSTNSHGSEGLSLVSVVFLSPVRLV